MPTETPLVTYVRLQRALDRDVLRLLQVTYASVSADLRTLENRAGIGAAVRADQLRYTIVAINREMSRFWAAQGDLVQAHQFTAAAAASEAMLDKGLLRAVFPSSDVDYLVRSARTAAQQSLKVAMERVAGNSYIPLAESVYNNAALTSGHIDTLVDAALGRGASAADLAKDVRAFINPNTPGGVRYASMRLGRTELNNAFHASQIRQAQESPWTTGVRWNLSGSHPVPDECNEYAESEHFEGGDAGVFKPSDVPGKPHPQCLCYTTTVDVDRDEFIRMFENGSFDRYLNSLGLPGSP